MRHGLPVYIALALGGSLASAAIAHADPAPEWDRVYIHGGYAGTWPCPEPVRDVGVTGGKFSIPWDVSIDNNGTRSSVNIGHIDGAVNPDGTTTATTLLFKPFPRAFTAQAARSRIPIVSVRSMALTVSFKLDHDAKIIAVNGGGCTVTWRAEPDKPAPPPDKPAPPPPDKPPADKPPVVDCNAGVYAVAMWVDDRDYKAGAFARFPSQPGQPTRLFRCKDGCAAGKSPADWDGTWAFVGQCQPH